MSAKSIFRTHLTKYQFLFNIIDGCIERNDRFSGKIVRFNKIDRLCCYAPPYRIADKHGIIRQQTTSAAMKYIKRYHTKLHPRAILLYPSLQLKYKMRRRYKYLIYKKHKKQRKRVNIVYFKTILMQQPHTIF